MKKTIYISLIMISIFLAGFLLLKENFIDEWNVILKAEDITSYKMKLCVLPQREYKNMEIIHKHYYCIEKYENDGTWSIISSIPFDYRELEYNRAYEYKTGYSYKLDWSSQLNHLSSGHYRIGIDFSALSLKTNDYFERIDDRTYYVEFDI